VPGHAAEVLAAIGGSPMEPDRKVAPKATKKVAKKVAGKPAAKPTRRARG
jgi:hypothetical protein